MHAPLARVVGPIGNTSADPGLTHRCFSVSGRPYDVLQPVKGGMAMAGIAIITESCIEVKDRACVDVCPVQCIYEFDAAKGVLFSEVEAGGGVENTHQPNPDAIGIFGDSLLYVNTEECTSCTACYQPDVCPVGAIYSEEQVPDGATNTKYNPADENKGHDHTFFVQLSRNVFAD
jgi:NAD-dependent dihydropyrimidine dehydrogenase PreA subunit